MSDSPSQTERLVTAGWEIIQAALATARAALDQSRPAIARGCLVQARRTWVILGRQFAHLRSNDYGVQLWHRYMGVIEDAQRALNLLGTPTNTQEAENTWPNEKH